MPTTPIEWLTHLEKKLEARRPDVELVENYYAGEHRLAFSSVKFREAFGRLFAPFADNWMGIVIDSAVERLTVEGFRFGGDKESDDRANAIWQANRLDARAVIAHTEACKHGVAYALVDPLAGTPDAPRITIEHPAQVYVEVDPGDRSVRLAALKKWKDAEDIYYANVYLTDKVVKFRTKKPVTNGGTSEWEQFDSVDHSLGVVPIVPIENNPSALKGGTSDLKSVIPIQDAINKLAVDLLLASEYVAFPQRVLTGVEIPKDPVTNQPIAAAELKAAMSRLWAFENGEARVTQLPAANLENYVKPLEMYVQHLAAQTRTPPHYLLGAMVNISGDALIAAESGLVSKCKRKQLDFGDGWEEVLRLSFLALGDVERSTMTAETIWANPARENLAALADGLVKLRDIAVPYEALWERMGATPEQIKRWPTLRGLPPNGDNLPVDSNAPTVIAPGSIE